MLPNQTVALVAQDMLATTVPLCGLLLFFLEVCNGSTLLSDHGSIDFPTPTFKVGDQDFTEIRGELVMVVPFQGCSQLQNSAEVSGKIAFVDKNGCYPQEKIRRSQEAGAVAVLIRSIRQEGVGYYMYNGQDNSDILIPSLEVGQDVAVEITELLQSGVNCTVVLIPADNEFFPLWRDSPAWILLTIQIAIFSSVIIGLSAYKLMAFISVYGPELSVIQISLALHILGALLRLVYAVDTAGVRNLYTYGFQWCLVTLSFPASLAVNLLTAFYWAEMLSKDKVFVSAKRAMIPGLILIAVSFILEITSAVSRILLVDSTSSILSGMIYMITSFGTGVFFVVTGVKLLYFLKNAKSRLAKMAFFITAGGVGLLCFCVICTAVVAGGLASPDGYYFLTLLMYILLGLISLSQVIVFTVKKPKAKHNPS